MVITTFSASSRVSALSPRSSVALISGHRRMPEVLTCLAKLSLHHHAEGRKTRRGVFLVPLILTTCPEGKPDGHCAKAPHQYVLRGQGATLAKDCRSALGIAPSWDCVLQSASE